MGVELVTMVLPLPGGRDLDWDAAARAIRDSRLAVLWDTGELYPWESWLADVEDLPGAVPAFVALRAAQRELHRYACVLRGAVEHGLPGELIVLDTPTHRVWVTGGPSIGDWPGDLVEPAICLAEAGITDAAGFDGYTRYEESPIERRSFGFTGDDLRRVRFGLTAAHAAEQAAGMGHPVPAARGREWFDAWLGELESTDDAGVGDGRALLRFAARGLALCEWLKDAAVPVTAARLDERARELALIADEGALGTRPRRRSWSVAVRDCRRLAEDISVWFDDLDDPARHEDDDVRAFIRSGGGTFGDAIEVEVAARAVFAAVAALADLRGDEVAALLDVPPVPITSEPPRESEGRVARLDQHLALVVVGRMDWAAGELTVDSLHAHARDERREDLAEFRRLVTVSEYRRLATSQRVGADELFIAAPHFTDGPDIALSIGRLGQDGILDAAGVVQWSAPDP